MPNFDIKITSAFDASGTTAAATGLDGVTKSAGEAAPVVNEAKDAIHGAGEHAEQSAGHFNVLRAAVHGMHAGEGNPRALATMFGELNEQLREGHTNITSFASAMPAVGLGIAALVGGFELVSKAFERFEQSLEKESELIEKFYEEAAEKAEAAAQRQEAAMKLVEAAHERIIKAIEDENEIAEIGRKSQEEYQKSLYGNAAAHDKNAEAKELAGAGSQEEKDAIKLKHEKAAEAMKANEELANIERQLEAKQEEQNRLIALRKKAAEEEETLRAKMLEKEEAMRMAHGTGGEREFQTQRDFIEARDKYNDKGVGAGRDAETLQRKIDAGDSSIQNLSRDRDTAKTNADTANFNLGEESKKVLQELTTAIEGAKGKVAGADSGVAAASQSGTGLREAMEAQQKANAELARLNALNAEIIGGFPEQAAKIMAAHAQSAADQINATHNTTAQVVEAIRAYGIAVAKELADQRASIAQNEAYNRQTIQREADAFEKKLLANMEFYGVKMSAQDQAINEANKKADLAAAQIRESSWQ